MSTQVQQISTVLDAAADLLEVENAWIGGPCTIASWARTADGTETQGSDPEACAFCLYAAIEAASAGAVGTEIEANDYLATVVGTQFLGIWNHNPGRTQAEVVSKLREAALRAREAGR